MSLQYKIFGLIILAVISLTLAIHAFLDSPLALANPYHVFQIILVGLIVAGVIYWFLDRQLLSRLWQLNQQVNLITYNGNFTLRLPIAGQDELSQLTQTINHMLNTIDESSQQLIFDLQQLQQTDQALKRANRALKTVGASHQAVRQATLEQTFMQEICRILVQVGQYRLAWVGRAEQDEAKTVRPLAHWGDEQDYLERIQLSWAENSDRGRGPTGLAIRTQQPQVVRHILTNPDYAPWREAAMAQGFASSLALPLAKPELPFLGTLNIYAPEPDAFDFAEIQLLLEVADNLLYGLGLLKLRTEHEHTSSALQASEERFYTLVNSMDDIIFTLDQQQRHVGVFGQWLEKNQLTSELFLGKTACDIFGPAAAEVHEIANRQALAGEHVVYEWSNGPVSIQTSLSPLHDIDNEVIGIVGVGRDISQYKQATQALNEQQNFVATILDTVGVLVVVLDAPGRIVRFNRLCEKITGYTLREVQGSYFWDERLFRIEDVGSLKEVFSEIVAGYFPRKNINYLLRREGEPCLIDWTNTALLDAQGKVEYVISTGIDLTDQIETENIRHDLEQQLHQAQKMESIGRLAGGVAHDFNNMLGVMIGYTHLAMRRLPEDSPARSDMQIILQSAERATHLTRQLLTFARRQTIEPTVLKLNDLILNVDKMLRRLISEDIELITILDSDAGYIKADPGQFEQILFNLAVNARDAMPHGGKLTLQTMNITLNTSEYLDLKPGNYVRLIVTDTGMGMSAAVQAQIFEPFFTTKPVGKGTGLGLATCFGIVKQHKGHILVESEVGHGATFIIDWPRVMTMTYQPAQLTIDPTDLPKGPETILLVEDEVAVRQMTVKMLRELGYTMLEAGNGEEALRLLENPANQPIHLVLTDLVMPQMGGRELAEHLRKNPVWADIKILFMSGYAGEVSLQRTSGAWTDTILQKPFSMPKLALKVRAVLDED